MDGALVWFSAAWGVQTERGRVVAWRSVTTATRRQLRQLRVRASLELRRQRRRLGR